MKTLVTRAILMCGAALLMAPNAFAAASEGLKWNAVTTYNDGSSVESAQKVVYLLYDQDGQQVTSTFNTSLPSTALPKDGCYFVEAGLYNAATNNVVPKSQSDPAAAYCTKPKTAPPPDPPAVKKLATPTGFGPQ